MLKGSKVQVDNQIHLMALIERVKRNKIQLNMQSFLVKGTFNTGVWIFK